MLVADCDGSAGFAQNFYDVSLERACDINSAGNTYAPPLLNAQSASNAGSATGGWVLHGEARVGPSLPRGPQLRLLGTSRAARASRIARDNPCSLFLEASNRFRFVFEEVLPEARGVPCARCKRKASRLR